MTSVRIATRRSPLALAQAEWVAARLAERGHTVDLVRITSHGDVDRRNLTEIGGTGVFATAVRAAVESGEVDLAVHSLKDLPAADDPALELVAVPRREDPREVLVGLPVDEWTDATVVGTGSPRRHVQLAALAASRGVRPRFAPVRGNVDTRIALVRDHVVDATVLAAAGLRRLGRIEGEERIRVAGLPASLLALDDLLPAAGQAALALECLPDSPWRDAFAALDDPTARAEVTAERAFLLTLRAGCLAPIGAHATADGTRVALRVVLGPAYGHIEDPGGRDAQNRVPGIDGDQIGDVESNAADDEDADEKLDDKVAAGTPGCDKLSVRELSGDLRDAALVGRQLAQQVLADMHAELDGKETL